MTGEMTVCVVVPELGTVTETFIRAHVDRIPGAVHVVEQRPLRLDGRPLLSVSPAHTLIRKMLRAIAPSGRAKEVTRALLKAFKLVKPHVVLAEYGPTGVAVAEACVRCRIPYVVHFHGADASAVGFVERYRQAYHRMFCSAAAIVAVSRPMMQRLRALGAPDYKLHLNCYGVDCDKFRAGRPGDCPPTFLAVGRLVEKKAPHLTLLAFAEVVKACPAAQLRVIGDGPLRPVCESIIRALRLQHAVLLLGPQPSDVVAREMRRSRCFVQHSVTASDGDCEGTPVAILEAGASGLPVVATRHGGIPEVVIHNHSGFLVDEFDVQGMAAHMLALARDARLAEELGSHAREHVQRHFAMEKRIAALWAIIETAVADWRSKQIGCHALPGRG